MSRRSLRGIATKSAAALVLVAAGATTGVVAAAENANENQPEIEVPADQAAQGLQTAEDAKATAEVEVEVEQAGGLPEDLPEQAVADEVLDVITTWDGDRGADFGAAVADAAQSNRPDDAGTDEDAGSQADDAGSQADEVRQDGDHRPSND